MEKKRWGLILMAVCLALAFSVSSVEAQEVERQCKDGMDNDRDGFIDCEDSDCSSKGFCKGENPEPAGTILICHFSPNGMHCGGIGGLFRTIKNDIKSVTQHNEHGDCSIEIDDSCDGHCLCVPRPEVGAGTIPVPEP